MAGDRARNTLAQALKVNLSAGGKSFKDFIGQSDQDDLYRLTLSNRSRLDLKVTGIQRRSNLDVELFTLKGAKRAVLRQIGRISFSSIPRRTLNRNITRLGRSARLGNKPETLDRMLEAGDYYLRVYERSGNTRYRLQLTATAIASPSPSPSPSPAPVPTPIPTATQPWLRQFGTGGNDYAYGVAVDGAGNVYMAGTTRSAVGSTVTDGFVVKYDLDGNLLSTKQFDVSDSGNASDIAFGIALDSAGNYYVSGLTNLTGTSADGFIAKFNSSGDRLWRQLITSNAGFIPAADAASSIALREDSAGNVSVYVAGFQEAIPPNNFISSNPSDAFVAKYQTTTSTSSTAVNRSWLKEYGGAGSDGAAGVAVDSSGNVYITGITNATLQEDLNNPFSAGDAFVAKFDDSGTLQWEQILGTAGNANIQDYARGIAVDAVGNIYITGQTDGTLPGQTNAGNRDGFVARYGPDGTLAWVRQFGSTNLDESQSIAVDRAGNVYLTGEALASIFSNTHAGASDAWFAKYDATGTLLASRQIGIAANEETYGITVDGSGNIYVVGQTQGALAGTYEGVYDAWVGKFPPV